ncbi:hypothetical protein BF93_10125 [Brachybacterium phenoliresistens]|uniref:Tat pathway signal sequence domain protein n=1 Tax=Brachybacterium phenoliresistens TaxID=396014 RepID=Z9JNU4_9MICO|nr:hypothetical protein [Brachybacterium phenoliresistens]EWS79678.1 hypothetical protein BF93_10125 [Brachybacterium phenoliresistens]
MVHLSRRTFVASAAVAAGAAQVVGTAAAAPARPAAPLEPADPAVAGPVPLHWIEGGAPAVLAGGTTWGVPWPRGALAAEQEFSLTADDGADVPVQTWPLGYWPDGTLKWSGHAISQSAPSAESYSLAPGTPAAPESEVSVREEGGRVMVDTGVITAEFRSGGRHVLTSITRGDTVIAKEGVLVGSSQNGIAGETTAAIRTRTFQSAVESVTVEQNGPVRAVVKVTGTHGRDGTAWLPFTLRFSLFAGSDAVRLVHTFIYDGDVHKEHLASLGVAFTVPMRGELHDRHVRLAGADRGVLGEAVRGITGLRRDPGDAARTAQVEGAATPDPSTWDQRVTSRLHWIPAWGEYSLRQLTAHGFEIRKRTAPGQSWIRVDGGTRAAGLGYVGGPGGGLAFGLRNFWQLHPTELQIAGAASDAATATVWMYSPHAGPMDLRPYHDGMGQDTYPEQLDALEITYEDYEPGFDTPVGVARTSELMFWALGGTPGAETFADLAEANATPPLLASPPAHNSAAGVFGSWSPVDRSTPQREVWEDRLAAIHSYHLNQVEQRSWYGFWDYGDVMHSYDDDRHQWRYDVGGYAWDNSELSTDLWLWYHYLRTGDAAAFRFAEAMSRHTGEVDQYHLGQWKGLGTRHGILHWGDSAKQVRISNANYRRIHYFLTADERTGDLLHELIDSDETFMTLDPIRKIRTEPYEPDRNALSLGQTTDWGSIAGAWLAEWERGGEEIARTKLINSVTSIAALPNGWVQGDVRYDLDTGTFAPQTEKSVSVGSLSSVFGLIEVMTEIVDLLDDDAVRAKWTEFCRLYNASKDEQKEATGASWGNLNLRQAYSRATAYASVQLEDPQLAERAWQELRTGHAGYPDDHDFGTQRIEGPAVLNPVDEGRLSTNASAQFGLAVIACLALVGDALD